MWDRFFLLVARLLTKVFSAIEWPPTDILALECSGPFFCKHIARLANMGLSAFPFWTSIATKDNLLLSTTVASSMDSDFACTTEPFVAGFFAYVLTARQDFSTYLTTSPALSIVGIHTSPFNNSTTTEATLSWSHSWARWTGS
ncbi:hypothetical protein, variant 2 [Verruconis gallopava]|uniref:Secreted protein n=1 Tax=Verruconis gallopava TaxID=253628 RepID=A0A0D1YRZ7_9PEZI|nr:uncharacterized protein PV09_05602 [Verruconis gallopava]XP_016213265.1 hypothetical protein, variant 1 [Verruconis gallopava]XP_016213266.1 hypothetical protein, variant 2 [Verruconis gallopava]KIW03395.1 hypothetical protein PV09_05602 [Verruconis gallopava]KIW03396.1 hypothetical protein, variant 1 [Verruconis gallopava]KIW03397.1 hypothetical protein, variant 2 [Verruconis gallopava]